MSVSNVILPLATALLITDGVVGAVRAVVEKASPPPIEGVGSLPETVPAGLIAMARWDIVKRTDCRGLSSRVWEGADGFYLVEPQGPTTLPVTTDVRTYRIPTPIPSTAPEGELSLTVRGHYICGDRDPVPFTLGPAVTKVVAPFQ